MLIHYTMLFWGEESEAGPPCKNMLMKPIAWGMGFMNTDCNGSVFSDADDIDDELFGYETDIIADSEDDLEYLAGELSHFWTKHINLFWVMWGWPIYN